MQAKGKNSKAPPPPAKNNGKGRETKGSKTVEASDAEWGIKRQDVRDILASIQFDIGIGLVIVLNAMTIGIEQTQTINGQDTLGVKIVESFFLVIYIAELGMRFFGHGFACLRDRWVKFDFLLVVIGILNSWILEPALDEAPQEMAPLMLLRSARLMRLAKTAWLLAKNIQEFWMLVRGLMHSVSTLCYIFIVLISVMYCFTSLGIELITKHHLNHQDEVFRLHVEKYFSTVPQTMLTLLQFMTLDDISAVYKPLCEKDPWLTIYFISLVLVISILFANLVAAVIISSTLEANQREHDAKSETRERDWSNLIARMKNLFSHLDYHKAGQVTLEELIVLDEKDLRFLCETLQISSPKEFFTMMDKEGTGEVSVSEFFDRILDMELAKGDANLKRMERQIEAMFWRIKERFAAQTEMSADMKKLTEQLEDVWAATCGNGSSAKALMPHNGQSAHLQDSRVGNNSSSVDFDKCAVNDNANLTTAALQKLDPGMASWERDMAQKVRGLVDDGLQIAFERLRKVAETAKGEETSAVRQGSTDSQPTRRRSPAAKQAKRSPSPSPTGTKIGAVKSQAAAPPLAVGQAGDEAGPSQTIKAASPAEPTSPPAAPGAARTATKPLPKARSQEL